MAEVNSKVLHDANNRPVFDELGKAHHRCGGAAQGVRKEVESVVRAQAETHLRELDIVQREEFEAVKAMAQKAREENEKLEQRIALLEEVLEELEAESRGAADAASDPQTQAETQAIDFG